MLEKYDVVITTLQTLQSEFKNHNTLKPVNASKSSKSSKSPKSAAADSSSDSDDSDVPELVKKKNKKAAAIPASALFGVKWLRIILDEAQVIKNRNAQGTKAAVALKAKFRWCLTG